MIKIPSQPHIVAPIGTVATHQQPLLVVDDEEFIVRLLQELLEDAGYEVLTANNGRTAMNILTDATVALVLTDLMMPHMDGWKLCQAVRAQAHTASLPVVLMSAGQKPAWAACFDDFIAKPFEIDHLLTCIDDQITPL